MNEINELLLEAIGDDVEEAPLTIELVEVADSCHRLDEVFENMEKAS